MITDDRLNGGWKTQYDMLQKQKGNVWKGQVDRIVLPGNDTLRICRIPPTLCIGTKLVTEAICTNGWPTSRVGQPGGPMDGVIADHDPGGF